MRAYYTGVIVMRKIALFGLASAAVLAVTATALAYSDTSYFTILRLEASSSSSDGYRVYPSGYSLPTEGCGSATFAEVHAGPTAAEKDLMSRTLLSAFLSGKQVKLRLDGCGISGRPAYRIVTISN